MTPGLTLSLFLLRIISVGFLKRPLVRPFSSIIIPSRREVLDLFPRDLDLSDKPVLFLFSGE